MNDGGRVERRPALVGGGQGRLLGGSDIELRERHGDALRGWEKAGGASRVRSCGLWSPG